MHAWWNNSFLQQHCLVKCMCIYYQVLHERTDMHTHTRCNYDFVTVFKEHTLFWWYKGVCVCVLETQGMQKRENIRETFWICMHVSAALLSLYLPVCAVVKLKRVEWSNLQTVLLSKMRCFMGKPNEMRFGRATVCVSFLALRPHWTEAQGW